MQLETKLRVYKAVVEPVQEERKGRVIPPVDGGYGSTVRGARRGTVWRGSGRCNGADKAIFALFSATVRVY